MEASAEGMRAPWISFAAMVATTVIQPRGWRIDAVLITHR